MATDVPGRERDWAEGVMDALARLETALRQHRAGAKAPDGPLAEVDETRPTLARQADELRKDHDEFLAQSSPCAEECSAQQMPFNLLANTLARPVPVESRTSAQSAGKRSSY